ncbi:sulfotransferase family protein [Glacieibacterium sp.]|uniref:sulfotransferase family protein n=1 Tax=Glacieibacterium sp. TaxID=2860237 RepID=UPI003B0072C0
MIRHRYVFVGGLHRSGTSLVARILSLHPEVAAISGSPVPENEGVYLQGAIPHTAQHGWPLHFATDPAEHLVEGCRYDTLHTRLRLEADWAPWFDTTRSWRVEKSPVNLTRARLYQQLFPLAQFVMVLRHPQAVSAAMAKWSDMLPAQIIDHWLHAHERLAVDLPYLHSVMVLRYEDLVADPAAVARALYAFLQLDPPCPDENQKSIGSIFDGNANYPHLTKLTTEQSDRLRYWKYKADLGLSPEGSFVQHPLRSVRDEAQSHLRSLKLDREL